MQLAVQIERFPLRQVFRIARGAKTEAPVVVAELTQNGVRGRGECGPNARYGETVESVAATIESVRGAVEAGLDRTGLQALLKPGAARNALDCAFWDLEAKQAGKPAWQLAGLATPKPVHTVLTISLDDPDKMEAAARAAADLPLLKLKLAGDGNDVPRVAAVRRGAPQARLIADANEGYRREFLIADAPQLAALGIEMLEQPLPAAEDEFLRDFDSPLPLGADESAHALDSLPALIGKYSVVNIKLDKTGGLTEALALAKAAREAGFEIMVGCMLGSSLGMAPGVLVAQMAKYVDLDAPLLLAKDRVPALAYTGVQIAPPDPALWG
ncbi:N-acetyl-D-Glu racemase DgcA [Roseiterribacter gracilis]|uniref:N-acetyl-D-Glu racemase DgcA n=1 Tax=Roseiterribacter gracilis TaxID=2812848 RepID=UPI003B43C6B9